MQVSLPLELTPSGGMAGADQPLAIVGIGCKFPGGVTDADTYWSLLSERRSGIREVPPERWDWRKFHHTESNVPGRIVSRWGGFVDGYNLFDANLFGITPREAHYMDPQQRWLLETSWRALEDAGIPAGGLSGHSVGVFVGISTTDMGDRMHGDTSLIDIHSGTGSALSIAANRLSFIYNFKGPSMAVDTACSSALVALALACRSLLRGECDMALAGGANALLSPKVTMIFSRASMLSPDGRCFTFDARANGYVRGEGAGVVVIKRLADALAAGDHIHAVIRSAVVNQDGRSSSLTVPDMASQEAMLREAYARAGIDTAAVSYVEAHGTGTPIGDPIEAHAIGHVLGANRPEDDPCLIGSVKTNIGHLEPASGVAGLIKAALILRHGVVPPHLNFEKPNPLIPLDDLGLRVVSEAAPLPRYGDQPQIVGVNSFGFGGTNAHVVLEQAPPVTPQQKTERPAQRPVIVPLSAADPERLVTVADTFQTFLKESAEPVETIAAAAGKRRDHLPHRLAVIGETSREVRDGLREFLNGAIAGQETISGQTGTPVRTPVFVFTGQGSQWWGMGQQVLAREPVVREMVERIDGLFSPLSGWSLLAEMMRGEADTRIDDTDVAQPALFALQVALAELWETWGIRPAAVIGHSVGEVAAAYVAGVYSLDDAVRIIFHRSRLQHTTLGQGNMAAVGLSLGETLHRLNGHKIHIAAINSPNMLTIAGKPDAVSAFVADLAAEELYVHKLPIEYGFHTDQMDPIREDLLAALAGIQPRAAEVPFVSTVSGDRVPDTTAMDAGYWWRNVRQPVSFSAGLMGMIRGGENTFLEIGPHPALGHSIHECLAEAHVAGHIFHSLRRDTDESRELLSSLGRMHIAGLRVDWEAANQMEALPLPLPPYPMRPERFDIMSDSFRQFSIEPLAHPLLGERIEAPLPTWETALDARILTYLADHYLWDSIVFPAAGYIEMVLAVASDIFHGETCAVEDMVIKRALFIPEQHPPVVRTIYNPEDHSFSIYSTAEAASDWQLHVVGYIRKLTPREPDGVSIADLRASMDKQVGRDAFNQRMVDHGYTFGPEFRHIDTAWVGDQQGLGEIRATETVARDIPLYHFHPALLDACLQTFGAAGLDEEVTEALPYLPAGFSSIRQYATPIPDHFWAHVQIRERTDYTLLIDIKAYDDAGQRLAEITGARLNHVQQASLLKEEYNHVFQFKWEKRRLRGASLPTPADFPGTGEIGRLIDSILPDVQKAHRLDRLYKEAAPAERQADIQSVQNAFLTLGWDTPAGDTVTFDDLVDRLGIIPRHHSLFRFHLNVLTETGYLSAQAGSTWQVLKDLTSGSVGAILAESPAIPAPDIKLITCVSENLADLYRGRVDPLKVLFPDGSTALLQEFYETGAEHAPHYDLIAAALRHICDTLPEGRPLRILEIGAGTGGLTSTLYNHLPMDRVEYTFTDISQRFLQAARQRFTGDFDYAIFDVNQDLEAQGFTPGTFDVVLAANVLHTLPDIHKALSTLGRCLVSDGLLMLFEVTTSHSAYTSIFGLLPEWWRHDENGKQLDTLALQSPDRWLADLAGAGFREASGFRGKDGMNEGFVTTFIARAPEAEMPPAAGDAPPANLLLFTDRQALIDDFAATARPSGLRVIGVRSGPAFEQVGDDAFTLAPHDPESLRQLFDHLDAAAVPIDHMVIAWGLDQPPVDQMDTPALVASQETGVLFAYRLVLALASRNASRSPHVVFLNRDSQPVLPEDRCTRLESSMLSGFVRVVNNEYPEYRWQMIDLDAAPSPDEIRNMVGELTLSDDELEVAYRAGARYVNRITRLPIESLPRIQQRVVKADPDAKPYRLEINRPGRISNLSLNLTSRCDPGPDEIEVGVRAAGINFRDLMKVLGLFPGLTQDLRWLGDDVSGVVLSVGEGVTQFKPGDAVFGFAPYGFRSHVIMDARLANRKPTHISFAEAATIPTVFATAWYALVQLARMRKGERVLIHAGTGGVGQAAIQVAQDLGLEIFATAGTPEKRALLVAQGVPHVFSSRSLDFAGEIMATTDGRGVDAVLNSLAGDFIPKSLSVLAPFGRYLEIGKVDVYNNSRIGLEALKDNISLYIIDLSQMRDLQFDLLSELTGTIEAKFAQSIYRPLQNTIFPVSEAQDAFRHMATAQHIGKIVLSFEQPEILAGVSTGGENRFRSDGSYLVVGGTRGFGLEIVRWMAGQGARHFTLMSRRGVVDDDARRLIDKLRADGVNVTVTLGDVTVMDDVRRVVDDIQRGPAPLTGVIHSALLLHDALLAEQMDESVWAETLWSKAAGGWNLHQATLGIPLEHFICISSSTSMYGSSTQSNYAAGNAFLDGLAHYRQALGLPALTINSGPMSGAGYLARDKDNAEFLDALGIRLMPVQDALAVLGELLQTASPQSGNFLCDWNKVGRSLPMVLGSKMFARIAGEGMSAGADGASLEHILAAPAHERPALLQQFLVKALADVMDTKIDQIDLDAPLSSLGLDSLMSVELVNLMNNQLSAFHMTIGVSEVLRATTLQDIAVVLVNKFQGDTELSDAVSDLQSGAFNLLYNLDDRRADIDFEAEAALAPEIIPSGDLRAPAGFISHILLTGGTGFLGAFLLRDLLHQTSADVTCLVRAEGQDRALARIRENMDAYGLWEEPFAARVRALAGDIGQPRLGLDEEAFEALASEVDAIIHNASTVNLVQPYHTLKPVNVQGVEEILRLATTSRLKPVHYVSTISVFYASLDDNPLIKETDWPVPDDLPNGYRQSKWVAEQLIRKAMERGIPCTIYRPGIISGDSRTGVTNVSDMASRVVIGVNQLGAVSERDSIWNMVPVDYVSGAIVHLLQRPDAAGGVFHLTHPQNTRFSDVVRLAGLEGRLQQLAYHDWRTALIQQAQKRIDNALVPLLPFFPEAETSETAPDIDCRNTLQMLSGSGIECPPVDSTLLATYMKYLVEAGALKLHIVDR